MIISTSYSILYFFFNLQQKASNPVFRKRVAKWTRFRHFSGANFHTIEIKRFKRNYVRDNANTQVRNKQEKLANASPGILVWKYVPFKPAILHPWNTGV